MNRRYDMTDNMFKYYTSIKSSVSSADLKKISPERYDFIEQQAYDDVQHERKARGQSFFKNAEEHKAYLLNLIDFAYLAKFKISPILKAE